MTEIIRKSGFSLLTLFVLIGFYCCDTGDIENVQIVQLSNSVRIKLPDIKPDSTAPQLHRKISLDYVALISGSEAITGISTNLYKDPSYTSAGLCWSTSHGPTISDNKLEIAMSSERAYCSLPGLKPNTTYYVRTYATWTFESDNEFEPDTSGTECSDERSFSTPPLSGLIVFNPDLTYGSVEDLDGNIYRTIQIGTQTWMAENLKATRYNDGSWITNVIDKNEWNSLTTGACCWYENDRSVFGGLYGALYNWYSVSTGKLCPAGWHVPDDEEWKQLEMALGMSKEEADRWGWEDDRFGRGTDEGDKIKTITGWTDNNDGKSGNGTNVSGFSALPGGDTGGEAWYEIAGQCTSWWTSTEGVARVVDSGSGQMGRNHYYNHSGFSVRCVKN